MVAKDAEDAAIDACENRSGPARELFPYQKLVRDYLLSETPYRGLLLYHGLGSGKTCSSIAVAESLLNKKKIYVLATASLLSNFKGELKKCGNPMYQFEQHWVSKSMKSEEDRKEAKSFGISDSFLDKYGRYYTTVAEASSNYKDLSAEQRKELSQQIDDVINTRFEFIAYNGISSANVDKILPPDQPDKFDDSVVIIDEAHNFISMVVGESTIKTKLYDMIYRAKDTKIVCLSGTPVLNRPYEISFLMNLLRGPIERINIPTLQAVSWDEGLMTAFFRDLPDVNTIEYNSVKRVIQLTRNPPEFESVYNDKKERIAVKYNKTLTYEPDSTQWVDSWRSKFQERFGGIDLAPADKIVKEDLECLPTNAKEFDNLFVDGLSVKNALLFQRRIQGLVSYFKGADERLVARRIEEDKTLNKIEMSGEQFLKYLEDRWKEIKQDSSRGRTVNINDDSVGSMRAHSRADCNFSIPPEFAKQDIPGQETEDFENPEILEKLKENPDKYLSPKALAIFSPKMLEIIKRIKENLGTDSKFNNQLVYSFYKSLQGIGILSAVLDLNGFQRYKLKKTPTGWEEDESMKPGIPAYATYTGDESQDEREIYRQIFNDKFEQGFPEGLKQSIKERRLCIFMISRAGAEGINLENVREVHIMESHWNPALLDQVIGRAIRICSHSRLPLTERTVRVHTYITVFSKEQQTGMEGPNIVMIRRNDMKLKRYDVDHPVETFMTSDEYLYEIAYEKGRIAKNITHLLKQAAIDCQIHLRLHSKEKPVIQCMRFDTTVGSDDLAYNTNMKTDEQDTFYLKNIRRVKRRLQRVSIKDIVFIFDPDTNEIFDVDAFDESRRLLKLGTRATPGEIHFFA